MTKRKVDYSHCPKCGGRLTKVSQLLRCRKCEHLMGTQNVVDMGPFPSADMIGAVPRGTYGFNLTDTRPDGYYPEDATQRSKDRRFNPKVDERLK